MAVLELVHPKPDWGDALEAALARPPGVPERRDREKAAAAKPETEPERPRRVADDLRWLRQAVDEPGRHGLREMQGTAAVAVWEAADGRELVERLCRLRDRGVLDAAGFLLHESSADG